jgi:hypothetical protein
MARPVSSFLSVLMAKSEGKSYQFPVTPPDLNFAWESVEYERNSCSPHEKYHALEVELSAKYIHLPAMVHNCMVSMMKFQFRVALKGVLVEHCRETETYCETCEIYRADDDVFGCSYEIPRWNFCPEKIQRESCKQSCSNEMGVDVDCRKLVSITGQHRA